MNPSSFKQTFERLKNRKVNRINLLLAQSHQKGLPPPRILKLLNKRASLEESHMKYMLCPDDSNLFIVQDSSLGQSRLASSLARCQWLYRYGFMKRYLQLGNSYCLESIHFRQGDLIIDCGANYGDLYGYLASRLKNFIYAGIEPSRIDYACLQKNIETHNSIALNIALGDFDGSINLYEDVESANSSVLPPPHFSSMYQVELMKLGSVLASIGYKGHRIRLLKIEAEGYEPEICRGAHDCLDKIDYIAVDAGFERGVHQETTAPSVINFLASNNFNVCGVGPLTFGLRLLFKNRVLIEED